MSNCRPSAIQRSRPESVVSGRHRNCTLVAKHEDGPPLLGI